MSGRLLQPVDLESLAARGSSVRERLSLNELPRLVEALPAAESNKAPVDCELTATLDQADQVTVRGSLRTGWRLSCQRCLGEVDYDVDVKFRWVFRRDETSAFVLTDEPVRLTDYIEDELLLELPQVPTHSDEADCASLVSQYIAGPTDAAPQPMRTPFAGLKDLMGGRES